MNAARLRIVGRVQGVGYRDWALSIGRQLGLRGWVRNRTDGSVEALIAGEAAAVAAMIEACLEGPSIARVDKVDVAPVEAARCARGLYAAADGVTASSNTSSNVSANAASRSARVTGKSQIDQRCHAVPGNAAGHDAVVVREVRLDVDRDAVERHPVADAHTDGSDLVLARAAVGQGRFVGAGHPDADPAVAALRRRR